MAKAISYFILAFLFISFSSYPQSLFAPKKSTQTPKNGRPALTAQDYISKIKAAKAQTTQTLQNELKDELSKRPPLAPQAAIPNPTSSSPTIVGPQPPPAPGTSPPPIRPTGTPAVQNIEVPTAPPPPSIQMTPQPTQREVYSGFQPTPNNGNQKNSSGQSSGGWNIKY